jgi:3-(3-hydroxy-phenyl)propionate hydroxylase
LSLNGPDLLDGPDRTRVGAPCVDAPLANGFLLERLGGPFTLLAINTDAPAVESIAGIPVNIVSLKTDEDDPTGAVRARYLGTAAQALYLIRPDQHVAARWHDADMTEITAALRVATGQGA